MRLIFCSASSLIQRFKLVFLYLLIAINILLGKYTTVTFGRFSTVTDLKKGQAFIILFNDEIQPPC